MEKYELEFEYEWHNWVPWDDIKKSTNVRNKIVDIPESSGVYEVRRKNAGNPNERLTIGCSANLRDRVQDELVKGDRTLHNRGPKIREKEDTSKIEVRWATTIYYYELELDLQRKYIEQFGALPEYDKRYKPGR